MTPIVQLRAVSKSYATATGATSVLRGVDLTIEAGDKASLVGPSGSGKSTLLSLIAGLLRPDDGSVEIDGHRVSDLDDTARARLRAQRIGIALQADNLIPFLNARENIELALAFGGHSRHGGHGGHGAAPGSRRRDARTAATDLLDRFGLADRAKHLPRHLSGGEAQRVALAVSMANEPDLLLADEIVAQLDGGTAARVIDDVLAAPCAVLFVTHVVALADQTATRYELRDGAVHRR